MKCFFRVIWIYIEVFFAKILNFFNIKRSIKDIPKGLYCYKYDGTSGTLPDGTTWCGTKVCPYYRNMRRQLDAGCTYVGFVGFDCCLGDQCKICGENKFNDEDEILK